MDHIKTYTVDLDYSCQELSVRGLEFVVCSPSGLFGKYLLYASTGGAIQL